MSLLWGRNHKNNLQLDLAQKYLKMGWEEDTTTGDFDYRCQNCLESLDVDFLIEIGIFDGC